MNVMKCRHCGRNPWEHNAVLYRVNEKGPPQLWECELCLPAMLKTCPTCKWVDDCRYHTHPRYLADVMQSPAYPHTCGRGNLRRK